jgi:hypothetical protein
MAEYQLAALERARKPALESKVAARPERHEMHPVVGLQSRAGNQAIARMIQRESEGAEEEEEMQMKHDPSIQRAGEEEELQMKHDPSIQRAGEEEELQMKHDSSLQRAGEEELQMKHDSSLQRAGEEEELQMKHDSSLQRAGEEEELQLKHDPSIQRAEEELQMKHEVTPKVGLEGGPVGGDIETRVNSARGSGAGVPDGIRTKVESATGSDLSGVRVHQDAESDTLNRELTAKAFTTGSDIFLRSDASSGDSQLMAHELAHVVQQSSGRTSSGGSGMSAGAVNDPLEHEADQLAHEVLSGSAQRHAEEAQV